MQKNYDNGDISVMPSPRDLQVNLYHQDKLTPFKKIEFIKEYGLITATKSKETRGMQ